MTPTFQSFGSSRWTGRGEAGGSGHAPEFGPKSSADQGGVRAGGEGAVAEGGPEAGHVGDDGRADADALEVGEADRAVMPAGGAAVAGAAEEREPGVEGDGAVLEERREADGRGVERAAQIMMRLECIPSRRMDPADLQLDRGAAPAFVLSNRPPCRGGRGCVECEGIGGGLVGQSTDPDPPTTSRQRVRRHRRRPRRPGKATRACSRK